MDDEFWSGYDIWNKTRLTGLFPVGSGGWAERPNYLVELITAYQAEYEVIRG